MLSCIGYFVYIHDVVALCCCYFRHHDDLLELQRLRAAMGNCAAAKQRLQQPATAAVASADSAADVKLAAALAQQLNAAQARAAEMAAQLAAAQFLGQQQTQQCHIQERLTAEQQQVRKWRPSTSAACMHHAPNHASHILFFNTFCGHALQKTCKVCSWIIICCALAVAARLTLSAACLFPVLLICLQLWTCR